MQAAEAILIGRALFELGRLVERAVRAPREVTQAEIDAVFDRAARANARWIDLLPPDETPAPEPPLPGDDSDR